MNTKLIKEDIEQLAKDEWLKTRGGGIYNENCNWDIADRVGFIEGYKAAASRMYSFEQIAPLISALGQIKDGKSSRMRSFNDILTNTDMALLAKKALDEFHSPTLTTEDENK